MKPCLANMKSYTAISSSLSSTSFSSGITPQFRRQSKYRTVSGDSLFLFFVTTSAPLLNTRSDAADVARMAR